MDARKSLFLKLVNEWKVVDGPEWPGAPRKPRQCNLCGTKLVLYAGRLPTNIDLRRGYTAEFEDGEVHFNDKHGGYIEMMILAEI